MNQIEIWTDIVITALALATFFNAWKTKSLTDVVSEMEKQTTSLIEQNKELAKQTTVLVKSYELQNQLTLTERIPYFKSGIFYRNPNQVEGSLTLTNFGTTARKVFLLGPGPPRRGISFTDTYNGEIVIKNNTVTFHFLVERDIHDLKFDFAIRFISEGGNEFSQDFKVTEGIVICYPPVVGLTK